MNASALTVTSAAAAIAVAAADAPAIASPAAASDLMTATNHFLDRPHGRIAYTDQGSGPLVVMVPGLGDLKEDFRFLAPAVVAAGFRVVTMDIRGHGASSVGWPSHTSQALGSDIVALVRHLDAGPAIVVGNSKGAGAATWAATEAPEAVAKLVLIGPFVRRVEPQSWWKTFTQWAMIKVAFAGPWATSAWGSYFDSLYPTKKPADYAAYREKLIANLSEPGRMAAVKAMIDPPGDDPSADLATINAPTLVVMGTKDPDFPDPAGEAATVARLLDGTVDMVQGAGHYPHAEMPDATNPAIVAFIAGRAGA
jgi:pimeloyl-ACP methyl ester carboxylesterase